jgi:hypothetical protein
MKLKFDATMTGPKEHAIGQGHINGIDLTNFPDNARFLGNEETRIAGIRNVEKRDGVLYVTLEQKIYMTDMRIDARCSDWIDAADYDPTQCYVKAANPQAVELLASGAAEYFQDTEGGWSVRMIEEVAV